MNWLALGVIAAGGLLIAGCFTSRGLDANEGLVKATLGVGVVAIAYAALWWVTT